MYELRATRKRHRLGDLEWFDAAYKVYMVALFGGGTLLWLSGLVGDDPVSAAQADSFARRAPALLGMIVVLAFAAGLRSGSQGGPLALESADVSYVMLAPISRRAALLKPAVQRLRSAAFAGAGVCAVLGQLAGRRLPGSSVAWFGSGGLFGLNLALMWVGAALVAHALRVRLWMTTVIAVVGITWQAIAIGGSIPGPANLAGSLALWGWRQRGIDVIALVVTVVLVVAGLLMVARTSIDALARRSSLVAQLRFAVTMQDLRTVILLRRQLSHEHTRSRPWIRLKPVGNSHPIWRRGWQSLLRLPAGRLVRMGAVAAGAGACQVAVMHGTSPAFLGTAALTFLLGLDAFEPLSQEIDQPDRTDSFPIERGELLARHLIAPSILLIPFAVFAGATAVLVDSLVTHGSRTGSAAAIAGILALPTVLGGAAGAAISIVRDAPDPMSDTTQQTFMPPEMAGMSTVLRTIIPLAVSCIGAVSVLFVRQALESGITTPIAAAIRAGMFVVLMIAGVATWVRFRDRIRRSIKSFMSDGRAQTQQQRSSR
ncbi:MAG: hypothetical protein RLZZ623_302 [Actinomycetota bacterium]